jgi:hypothetical protein
MRNLVAEIAALVNDADGIAEDQTLAAAGNLDLDGALAAGGSVTLSVAQRVTLTSDADDTGVTFTVTGTNANGQPQTEDITGANAGASSGALHFLTITQIAADGATAGDVQAGVLSANGGVSKIIRVNSKQNDFLVGLFVEQSGTATWTVETTAVEPEPGHANGWAAAATWYPVEEMTGISQNEVGNIVVPVNGVRLRTVAYTSGTLKLTVTQAY